MLFFFYFEIQTTDHINQNDFFLVSTPAKVVIYQAVYTRVIWRAF